MQNKLGKKELFFEVLCFLQIRDFQRKVTTCKLLITPANYFTLNRSFILSVGKRRKFNCNYSQVLLITWFIPGFVHHDDSANCVGSIQGLGSRKEWDTLRNLRGLDS